MSAGSTDQAAAIFLALSHAPPEERARLLDEQCGKDGPLRQQVERLLGRLSVADSFLDPVDSVRADPERILQQPDARIGDFLVIRQIGSGGTGVVYLAQQLHPPRIVALKVLRREFVASTVQRRFEIEAELLGHLQHPGIAQIYAAHPGDRTTPPFIAMELVNGPPLTEYADSHGLSIPERVDLIARASDAVQHAHQRGIIHRDLKPGNILVNEEGQPKVLDFGIARAIGAPVSVTAVETETGQLLGTLAYMSPEQIEATPRGIDTRTDVHALGVILFRLLTGRLPFGHDDPPLPELARRIMQDEPPRIGTINSALRGDLEVIVSRALAKEKERRYASAADLATDLRRYLAAEPIAASHDSAWYAVRRRLERYRLALTASIATLLVVAGLAFYAILQRLEVQRQLTTSTIERGRLLSVTGNLPNAEELVWRELFRRPDSRYAQWALWEIYSREPALWSRMPHEGGTLTVRFSPNNRLLLTGGQVDGLMRLLDVESGDVVRTVTVAPRSGIRETFFTPDGQAIVSGSKDGTLRVWDVPTGALRQEIRAAPSLEDFAIAGGGAQAVTVAPGGLVQVWTLATGEMVADLSAEARGAAFVAADPEGTLVATGGNDGTVIALDIERRARLWQVQGHGSRVISLAVGPKGRVVATGGADGLVHLWDASSGARLQTIATENGTVRNLAFDDRGTKLAAAGQWRTRVWDLEAPLEPPLDFGGAEGMNGLDLRPDARFMATSHGASGLVRLWDVRADARTDHWAGRGVPIMGLALGGDGHSLFSVSNEAVLRWRAGQPAPNLSLQSGARMSGVAVSDDKRWLVSVGYPGTAAIWSAVDGRRVADLKEAGSSRAVLFADAGRRLVVGDADGTLKIWEWSDGAAQNLRRTPSPSGEVLALAAHGSRLFVAYRETSVVIREAASGREIRKLQPSASPFSIAVTPDGRLLAAGTWPGIVDIWDVESGRKLHSLKGPTAMVGGLDVSADSRLLALASRDGSTRLWDLEAGQWLATVASRKPGAERVRFLGDGRRLAIGYEDGEVEIRDLEYFFRYAAGQAEYQLRLLRAAGETFPRSDDVLAWSRQQTRK